VDLIETQADTAEKEGKKETSGEEETMEHITAREGRR
jgi:hypothetical protein